jgi:hypothetical protein
MAPGSNSEIAVNEQPVKLVVKNAGTSGVRPLSYLFEVATDNGFTQKVYSRGSVPPGEGQTTHILADTLAGGKTYYWRSRAEDGANTGDFSPTIAFTIYVPVVLEAPILRQPVNAANLTSFKPTFTVANVARSGPAGTVSYILNIATNVAFTETVMIGTYPEQNGETSMVPPQDLPVGQMFWRVKATDGKNESPWSATQVFLTLPVAGPPSPSPSPSPIPDPTPTPSPAAGDDLNMSQATILNSPRDLASWPVTTTLRAVDIRPNGVHVEFSKKDGSGRWPDITPPGWQGALQYTLGMCLNITGRWYCSAVVEFWHGLDASGGPPGEFAMNWFYDPIRWSPMTGHQPAVGETIGFFVCAGDCRNNLRGDLSPARERSNVVLVKMPGGGGANYRF